MGQRMDVAMVDTLDVSLDGGRIRLPKNAVCAKVFDEGDQETVLRYFWVMDARRVRAQKAFVVNEFDVLERKLTHYEASASTNDVAKALYDFCKRLPKDMVHAPLWQEDGVVRRPAKKKKAVARDSSRRRGAGDTGNGRGSRRSADIPSLVMSIHITDRKSEETCFIVKDAKAADAARRIYHYSSPEGRELMSSALLPRRVGMGRLDGVDYQIVDVEYADGGDAGEELWATSLTIQKNGGTYMSEYLALGEVVDLLLYSPYTKRLEIIKATRERREGYCFTDVRLFREFVRRYGNPLQARIGAGCTRLDFRGSGEAFGELREKSILNEYGYNVSSSDALSVGARREILAEMIDLDILPQGRILDYLDFFMTSHAGAQYEDARSKWKEDYDFVLHYRQNPKRFLVARVEGT